MAKNGDKDDRRRRPLLGIGVALALTSPGVAVRAAAADPKISM